jgi:hypothetical protein
MFLHLQVVRVGPATVVVVVGGIVDVVIDVVNDVSSVVITVLDSPAV